jgi:hypothetical protein
VETKSYPNIEQPYGSVETYPIKLIVSLRHAKKDRTEEA